MVKPNEDYCDSDLPLMVIKGKSKNQRYTEEEKKKYLKEAIQNGGYYGDNGCWNSIITFPNDNHIYRGRVETLVIKDGRYLFLKFISRENRTHGRNYVIPGGSFEKDVPNINQAVNECREEARLNVKNVQSTGLTYKEIKDPPKWAINSQPVNWNGNYTEIYIGEYDGKYTGHIDKVDEDKFMIRGKFYDIKEVYRYLKPIHKKALESIYRNNFYTESSSINKSEKIKYKEIRITKPVIDKYSKYPNGKFLSQFRTGSNNNGILLLEKTSDEIIGAVSLETKEDGITWIQALGVSKKYQNNGFGTILLKKALKMNATDLIVRKTSKTAIKLYRNNGFKIFKETDSQFWMSTKDRQIEMDVVTESMIKSKEDLYYNKEKFDSGEINLCFITGFVGSGKTTMANDMSDGVKTEMYQLDDVISNKYNFTLDELKEYGGLIYSFFTNYGKKYYYIQKDVENGEVKSINDYDKSIVKDFIKYSKNYAKSHRDKKYVVEGIWIYMFIEPSELKDYAVYIKGTSKLTSNIRAIKRDGSLCKGKTRIKRMIEDSLSKKAIEANKAVNKYYSYFSNIMKEKENTINESALTTEERKQIPDSKFGIPSQRRFPLNDREHVLAAIRMFNRVDRKHEKELACNIIKAMKHYNIDFGIVGTRNRLKTYL